MKAIVILPTYNEKENLEDLIRHIISIEPLLDILVIDDTSPDGTGEIADKLAEEFEQVIVRHRPPKSGRGSASIDGYRYAVENCYDFCLEMDVDFSHSPDELPRILNAATGNDVVIASRFIEGGKVVGWNWRRKLLHRLAEIAIKVILGFKGRDHTNGYKCYRVKVLKKLNFDRIKSSGYVSHTIVANVLYKNGYRIKEIPSVFRDRQKGKSKMHFREAFRGILDMIRQRFIYIIRGSGYFIRDN